MASMVREHQRTVCRLFHDWSKWGEPQKGKSLWHGEPIGDLWWQQRECERCGQVDIREIHR